MPFRFGLLVASLLLPIVSSSQTVPHEVRGSVAYREKMALPPDAVLSVHVDRFSKDGQVSLSSLQIRLSGKQVPITFALSWMPGPVGKGDRYGVRCEIRSGDSVLFECPSASMIGLKSLESVKVNLVQAHHVSLAFMDQLWTLVELQGNKVSLERAPNLTLQADRKLSGFTGVNRYFGSYEWSRPFVQIDPNGMTMMAGSKEQMELEQAFMNALGTVNRLSVTDGQLVLLRGDKVIARFHAH